MPRVRLPDGTVATFPDGTPPEQIESTLRQKFPAKASAKTPAGSTGRTLPLGPSAAAADMLADKIPPGTKEDRKNLEPFVRKAVEELYPGNRFIDIIRDNDKLMAVQARAVELASGDVVPIKKAEPKRTWADTLLAPKGFGEHAAQFAASLPLYAAGTMAAGPVAGPAAVAAGIGAAEALYQGKNPVLAAALDGAVAAATGGVSKLMVGPAVKGGLWGLGKAKYAFDQSLKAPGEALELIKDMLPKGLKVVIPSFGKGKLTPAEIFDRLKDSDLQGPAYKKALSEVADAMSQAGKANQVLTGKPKPFGGDPGDIVRETMTDFRKEPSGLSKAAYATSRAIPGPAVQAPVQAAGQQKAPGGENFPDIPVGGLALGAGAEKLGETAAGFGRFARHLIPLP